MKMGLGQSKHKTLPYPSGKYAVGCADIMTDHSKDGVFVRLFYPVEPCDFETRQVQFPSWLPRCEYLDGYGYFIGWPEDKFRFLFNWKIGKVLVPCLWHAPILPPRNGASQKLPVLIFSHGLGAMRTTYTTFCCDMASHGFVVAALEHRDRSACWTYVIEENAKKDAQEYSMLEERGILYQRLDPNEKEFRFRNRQLHKRVSECVRAFHLLEEMNLGKCGGSQSSESTRILVDDGFNWKQFTGRLDLSRTAVGGHSFGGATAIAACAVSSEFRVGLVLDGWMFPIEKDIYPRVSQPLLFVNMDKFQWKDNVQRMKRMELDGVDRSVVTIREAVHQSQTDFTFLMKGWAARKLRTAGAIDPLFCSRINNAVSLAFLEYHLGLSEDYKLPTLFSDYDGWLINGTNIEMEEKPSL